MVVFMINCRDVVGVVCFGDRLYVIGGYDGYKYLSVVELYDFEKNKWEEVVFLNFVRVVVCVVFVLNNLVIS